MNMTVILLLIWIASDAMFEMVIRRQFEIFFCVYFGRHLSERSFTLFCLRIYAELNINNVYTFCQ